MALAGLFVAASGVRADSLVLTWGYPQYGNGGEFLAIPNDGPALGISALYTPGAQGSQANSFETFCIQYNEEFSPGSTYNYQISTASILPIVPVTIGTGYLYNLFATGTLPGYTYTSASQAADLQNTLWNLQGTGPGASVIADPGTYDALLIAKFGSLSNAKLATFGVYSAASYGVYALNLGTTPDGNGGTWPNQDQLIYTGGGSAGGGSSVPDGGSSLVLLGGALGGLALLKRKLA
jgi:hypothetical protein